MVYFIILLLKVFIKNYKLDQNFFKIGEERGIIKIRTFFFFLHIYENSTCCLQVSCFNDIAQVRLFLTLLNCHYLAKDSLKSVN